MSVFVYLNKKSNSKNLGVRKEIMHFSFNVDENNRTHMNWTKRLYRLSG